MRDSEVPAMVAPASGNGSDDDSKLLPWEYSLRKYLLVLATLVATVTYTAGFTPPGGVWQETEYDSSAGGGHLAGDPIMRRTSYHRYVVFFYLNAAAFASSLVVIVLILILSVRHDLTSGTKWLGPLGVLRGFMVLDLLSLIGAYTAGIYQDRDVPVYSMVLAILTIVYLVVFHMVLPCRHSLRNQQEQEQEDDEVNGRELILHRKKREKLSKVLMLLATFAISVTYSAGLNAPGGFWDHAEGGHQPGEPMLMGGRHEMRLKVFVHLNSTAFFWSLLITVQLLDKNLRTEGKVHFRFRLLYTSIVLALLGLVGAYAAGSCREPDTTIYVILLGAAVPACIILLRLILLCRRPKGVVRGDTTSPGQEKLQTDDSDREAEDKARSLVLLLATLAATITYQAGLGPPGGLWMNDGNNFTAGDPILQTTNNKRYNVFFYCNSVAFVASLVTIILVKKSLLLQTHALQAAMILDLFGLIGAYAAGSCRDVSTSIYAMALAGAVLVYVVIHVLFLTLDHDTNRNNNNNEEKEKKALEVVEKRRKRLLLFAILVATITYQAGLTAPGGFRLQDDKSGHHAGDPVLLYNFPRRYKVFFYCNSLSFMLSIAMILLLVNKNLYKPAIQSHAISVCTAAGMVSLVGAYAAGSTQHLRTSIKIFGLVAAILIVLVAVVLIFVVRSKDAAADIERVTIADIITNSKEEKKQHAERKYLMLLGILAASVTYQAGLQPPGGMWQDDENGHTAGNPVMHDNGRTRYMAFFYINSTSFAASIIVIILLLMKPLHMGKLWLHGAMNTTIVLDLLGLLVAYAVGSSRSLEATGYVFMLVVIVLAYIAIHVSLSHLIKNGFRREEKVAITPES